MHLGALLIGYKGEDIPLVGRIVAVTDVFDALIKARPYKRAFSIEENMETMTNPAGCHFEPRLMDALVAILPDIFEDSNDVRRRARHGPRTGTRSVLTLMTAYP